MIDDLRAAVRGGFGLELASFARVEHGADEAAQLWRATDATGTRYAVKLTTGGSPAGLAVSAHLARDGVPGVPAPLLSGDGTPWTIHDGSRLSVVPWVSDDRALGAGMSAGQWRSFGRLLARVHASPATADLPRERHTHERATDLMTELEERLATGSHPVDPVAQGLLTLWQDAAADVRALLTAADRLGGSLRESTAPEVICHADPHLGNLLLGEGDTVWLIDWDDAVLAPPERDLMFAIGGVLAFEPVTPEQEAWFFDGYGPVAMDRTRLAYYRCVRALEDFAGFALEVLRPDGYEQEEREFALRIAAGILSPTGFVRLAHTSLP